MSIKTYKKLQFNDILSSFVHSFEINTFNVPILSSLYFNSPYITYYHVDQHRKLSETKFLSPKEAIHYFIQENTDKKEQIIIHDYSTQSLQLAIDKIENRLFCYRAFSYGNRGVWSLHQLISVVMANEFNTDQIKSIHQYTPALKKGMLLFCRIELDNAKYKLQICERRYNGEITDISDELKNDYSQQISQFIEAICTTVETLINVRIICGIFLFHCESNKKLWVYDAENVITQKFESDQATPKYMLSNEPIIPELLPPIPKVYIKAQPLSSSGLLGIKNSSVINVDRYKYQRAKMKEKIISTSHIDNFKLAKSLKEKHRSKSINQYVNAPLQGSSTTVLVPLRSLINFDQMQRIKKDIEIRSRSHTRTSQYNSTRTEANLITVEEKIEINGERMANSVLRNEISQNRLAQSNNDVGVCTDSKMEEINENYSSHGANASTHTKMNSCLQKTYFRFSNLIN